MPSFTKTLGLAVAGLAALASALPGHPKLTPAQAKIYAKRQETAAAAAAAGLNDFDILNFALTLEWLEATFYQEGFKKFPAADFQALGLSQAQITDLIGIGASEAAHVELLQSALAQNSIKPVEQCEYEFGFTDAKGMVATAIVLESVGISAYIGATAFVTSKDILATAASILTTEARHNTIARVATGQLGSPAPLDTPLSPKQVFSLAAPFIKSCPEGSNLILTAFPTLTMAGDAAAAAVAGATINLQSDAAAGATACAFTNGNLPGGTAFTDFTQGTGCTVPNNLAGVTYVNLVSQKVATGKITDDIILAGPMVMQVS
ncbi:ferritin-like domain-containing protein [Coniochaeta sp. 2T2.1]|nr:ferritin-like domain-containing protein [Coniochaeta sp. 2T2.1]